MRILHKAILILFLLFIIVFLIFSNIFWWCLMMAGFANLPILYIMFFYGASSLIAIFWLLVQLLNVWVTKKDEKIIIAGRSGIKLFAYFTFFIILLIFGFSSIFPWSIFEVMLDLSDYYFNVYLYKIFYSHF